MPDTNRTETSYALADRLAAAITPEQLPFLRDPEHWAPDLRPWSELYDLRLVENRLHPQGPSRTLLGNLVLAVLDREARNA